MADTRGIKAGRAYVELGTSDKLSAGLAKAQRQLQAFSAGMRTVGARMAGIGVAAVGGLFASARAFGNAGDALEEMSQRTGWAVEDLSALRYGAGLAGVEMSALEKAVRFMQKGGGTGSLAEIKAIADQLGTIDDPGERARAALEAFGKAGTDLLPLLNNGSAGIEAMMRQAERLGMVMSATEATDAARFNDALDTLTGSLGVLTRAIGAGAAPAMRDFARWITAAASAVSTFVKANPVLVDGFLKVAAVVVSVGAAFYAIGVAAKIAATGIAILRGVMYAASVAAQVFQGAVAGGAAGALAATAAAATALAAAIAVEWGIIGDAVDWVNGKFDSLNASMQETMKGFDELGKIKPSFSDIDIDAMSDSVHAVGKMTSTRAAIGGANFHLLSGEGGTEQKKIVKAAEETAKNTKTIAREMKQTGGSVFI